MVIPCSGEEQLRAWKEEMLYDEVKEEMMQDGALDRFCSPVRLCNGDDV